MGKQYRHHTLCRPVMSLCCLLSIGSYACGSKPIPDTIACQQGPISQVVTYESTIKPLMKEKCVHCHSPSPPLINRDHAPMDINYDTYENTKENASLGLATILNGSMPKNPNARLSTEQVCHFYNWYFSNMPK